MQSSDIVIDFGNGGRPTGRVALLIAALCIGMACALCFSGCLYKGAKVVDGTDLAVGIELPSTSGTLQINALNYLSGFRLAVQDGDGLIVDHSTTEEWNYFSVVKGSKTSRTRGKVVPPSPTQNTVLAMCDYPHELSFMVPKTVFVDADYKTEK